VQEAVRKHCNSICQPFLNKSLIYIRGSRCGAVAAISRSESSLDQLTTYRKLLGTIWMVVAPNKGYNGSSTVDLTYQFPSHLMFGAEYLLGSVFYTLQKNFSVPENQNQKRRFKRSCVSSQGLAFFFSISDSCRVLRNNRSIPLAKRDYFHLRNESYTCAIVCTDT
jgi:hypothetical protein